MGKRIFVIVCVFCILCVAVLAYRPLKDGERGESYFSWVSGTTKDRVVQLTTGKCAAVPFEFRVGSNVSGVLFEIKEDSLWGKGIFLEETAVQVRRGIASSRVTFNCERGARVRAGHYAITIIARDAASGKMIREGKIPFDIDMLDLIWKCSC